MFQREVGYEVEVKARIFCRLRGRWCAKEKSVQLFVGNVAQGDQVFSEASAMNALPGGRFFELLLGDQGFFL